MPTARILPQAAALVMIALATNANANVIAFDSPSQIAGIGDHVSFDISMDFVSNTVGGSFDVFYDANLLSFVSFEFDTTFLGTAADADFAVLPDHCFANGAAIGGCSAGDHELNGIGFGNFDGITGSHIIGTVTFQTLGGGDAVITMGTNDAPWEGFYSADDASELTVLYGPAKVQIVPLPAALWLLAAGVGVLGGFGRRRKRA